MKKQFSNIITSHKFEKEIKLEADYLLYLPKGYDTDISKRFPLIFFLHGAYERGNDIDLVRTAALPAVLPKMENFQFVVVAPQCSDNKSWDVEILNELLNNIEKKYRVDKKRIYLTGVSMGGYGTWHFAAKHTERFAAIAPVCGGGNPFKAQAMVNLPVWMFHGAKDKVVPPEKSQEMYDVLKDAGGNPKITIYPDADHDSWTLTYNNPELYKWFLSHQKS